MKIIASILALIVLNVVFTTPASAQSGLRVVTCDACRDPVRNPRDYRNFAYNQVFAPDGSMSLDDADIFVIENNSGQSLVADMNMDIETVWVDVGLLVPIPIPQVVRVQVILIYENGDQRKFMIDARAHDGALPVGGVRNRSGGGGSSGPGTGTGGAAAGGSQTPDPSLICGTTRVDGGRGRRTCILEP